MKVLLTIGLISIIKTVHLGDNLDCKRITKFIRIMINSDRGNLSAEGIYFILFNFDDNNMADIGIGFN